MFGPWGRPLGPPIPGSTSAVTTPTYPVLQKTYLHCLKECSVEVALFCLLGTGYANDDDYDKVYNS